MLYLLVIVGLIALSALFAFLFSLLGLMFWPMFVVFVLCAAMGFGVGTLIGRM